MNQNDKTSPPRALVVDDGMVERLAGKALLEKLGFRAETASSGEDALRMMAHGSVDLLLCDVSMPGMSGMDVLAATRALLPRPAVILVSSFNDPSAMDAALQAGAAACLAKPLRFDGLRAAVAEAVRVRQGLPD
ncbi:response regulator [Noviherbaspirillum galbum]|uniref:Response regulator n=1 Tax=Noviherbaspirillum galbum TaxID=2709383 RepID=A0A6B3SLM9_9BURK|nr:response regulator [Noviherbaspirillum galbum]NEX60275.1 response regulator [Noviherbaspirillum galbum]